MSDLSYRSPKTQVRDSAIHGKGLFATRALAAGEIVGVKGGHVVTKRQWTTLAPTLGSAEIQISDDLFVAPVQPEQREGSMLFTNHSCEPNIAIQGQIVFVAMRDIAPGEELTHDWATTDDLDEEMECRCGSPSCRGVVTGKDWMKKELQEKYRGWFCWFLQRKIDALSAIAGAYDAFNARDIDRALGLMHPEVEWPNGMDGGYVHGHDGVRSYWTRQWRLIDPHVEPRGFSTDDTGRIVVDVHQVVRDREGAVVADRMVQHVYLVDAGLVRHMEIRQ
jgi:uncharacterized protein